MPTSIPTLNPGDTILDTHIENLYPPLNNLETGAAFYGAAGGSTNAYTVTLSPTPGSYTSGMMVHMLANAANTGAATVNVNGMGAKTITKEGGNALVGGEIAAGQLVVLLYDGTNFQLLSGAASPAQSQTTTTNATPATLHTVAIASGRTYQIEARVQARRTGGSAGTAEDGASYIVRGTYKTVGGTVTVIGSVSADYTAEDQSGWDATLVISGSNVIVQVTGATNNDISWRANVLVSVAS